MHKLFLLCALLPSAVTLFAQNDPPSDAGRREWTAHWISHPTAPLRDPVVLHFRRTLHLAAAPSQYVVRVSADNRFILYVNGERIGDGPARGDLAHWRYERFDLAPHLKPGDNLITATVWNWGVYAPVAQISDRTAFLLESEATGANSITTPEGWLVEQEMGHGTVSRDAGLHEYFASGPGEEIDAVRYDWSANQPGTPSENWVKAVTPMRDAPYSSASKAQSAYAPGDNGTNFWGLVPDQLPHMEYTPTPPGKIVRVDSDGPAADDFKAFPEKSVTVPAHRHIHLLLDRKTLTTAYPELIVSGGKGARIKVVYSEALYDKQHHKGDRDEVGNRIAQGITDMFHPDGGDHRAFEPLWWRAWRYMDLEITTGDQSLQLEALTAYFSAYPFVEKARFHSSQPDLDKIWDISWRTARLDAHETYMDTPYYEQLQYVGDTRIQALISYAVTGDDRLARQALEAFNNSRIPEGITRSRYPSAQPQNIPTFSLLWIGMLHDWWMYRPDPAPIETSLIGTRSVLNWYAQYEQPDGLLRQTPWWSFIDWIIKGELSSYSVNGESCLTTAEYLGALDQAADLEQAFGDPHIAAQHRERAAHVRSGLTSQCWSPERKLLADNPDRKEFSEQANILGVLYDVIPKDEQKDVLRRMLAIQPGETPDGIQSASLYFRFYLARALDHAGMADEYLKSLDSWRSLLPLHFSTWPEQPGETRSDSHAWTAHPIYDLLTLVAGVEPASPGFRTVRIAPHLGDLPSIEASFPHPDGMIELKLAKAGSGLTGTITLPGKLTGQFVYNESTQALQPGLNRITPK